MAESIGFEPMLPLLGGRLSKPLPSTTRPTLQNFGAPGETRTLKPFGTGF